MNKTIKERAREAVGKAFTIMDLPPDMAQLVSNAIAAEFGDEKAYNPKTHICISNNAAEQACIMICSADEYDDYNIAIDEINAGLNENINKAKKMLDRNRNFGQNDLSKVDKAFGSLKKTPDGVIGSRSGLKPFRK